MKKVGFISTQGVGCFSNTLFQNKVATSYETEFDLFKAIPDLCEHALSNLKVECAAVDEPYIFSIDVECISKFREPIHYMATIKIQFKAIEEVVENVDT